VLAVIDASAMAQTFAAIVHGLRSFRPDLPFAGVIANRLGSAGHGALIAQAVPPDIYWGGLQREAEVALPERHLGLVQADEIADLEQRIEQAAQRIEAAGITRLPETVEFAAPQDTPPTPLLQGVRIGVARDAAFGFIYPANIDLLRALGADLVFFSPLHDAALPAVDSLWLPGGYPELHLQTLAHNTGMRDALRAHHHADKPLLAECGGMLYLLDELTDHHGHSAPMTGLLPGRAVMEQRLMGLGMQNAPLPGGVVTAHTFHHSRSDIAMTPLAHGNKQRGGAGEAIYQQGRLTASYLHLYFPSNPGAIAQVFAP
jgi:cobyrinic acid a,c-diamide synthase